MKEKIEHVCKWFPQENTDDVKCSICGAENYFSEVEKQPDGSVIPIDYCGDWEPEEDE